MRIRLAAIALLATFATGCILDWDMVTPVRDAAADADASGGR